MDERQNQSLGDEFGQAAKETAKAGVKAAGAAAKAATGNVIGAAKDVLTNPVLVKAGIAAVLVFIFLVTMVLSYVGSAITGAVNSVVEAWEENYDEAWLQRGIASNGSALYMFSFDNLDLTFQAIGGTILDVFDPARGSTVDGKDASNASLEGGDVYQQEDVLQTLEAMKDSEAMTGAIKRRLDMIKGRVAQRGAQIKMQAAAQYSFETIGNLSALTLANLWDNPFLFEGIAFDQSSVNVDTECFNLTDTQALKILCAFSVQYDSDLTSVDMWSLMHYCGWYDFEKTTLPSAQLADSSIYKTNSMIVKMGGDLEDVVSTGQDITGLVNQSGTVYYNALKVPYWSGTFVPQWVVEERAAIQEHNDRYWDLVEQGREIAPEDQMWGTQATRDSEITGFEKLDAVEPYGIIDKLFYSSRAQIVVTPTDVHTVTGIPAVLEGVWDDLRAAWDAFFSGDTEDTSYTDSYGNYITQTSVTYRKSTYNGTNYSASSGSFRLRHNGVTVSSANAQGGLVRFSGLSPNTAYTIYKKMYVGQGTYTWKPIYTFRTAAEPEKKEAQAYKMAVDIEISFSSLSIDQLISDTIGLWSGDLSEVIATETGIYQKGERGNENLLYQWTDSYTDSNGQTQTITFTRQHGYQAQAYSDSILALGKELLSDEEYATLTKLGNSYSTLSQGTGADIVAIAQAEYELPDSETDGGAKYWQAFCDYIGSDYSYGGAWCVCFVYYCAYQAGYLTEDGCFGSTWRTLVSDSFNYFSAQGRTYTSPDYVPEPGDLIYYNEPGTNFTHIGLVEYVDNGIVHTIEGNTDYSLGKVNGGVGKHAYGAAVNTIVYGSTYIKGYAKPNYPISAIQSAKELLYETVNGTLKPDVYAKTLGTAASPFVVSGLGRLSESQMRDFISKIASMDPEFAAKPEVAALIQTGAEASPTDTLLAAWNTVALTYTDGFKSLQKEYSLKQVLSPVYIAVKNATGFNWGKTQARLEILWALCTATQEQAAAIRAMTLLCGGLDDSASDYEVVTKYSQTVQSVITQLYNNLWPGMDETNRGLWEKTLLDLSALLVAAYPETPTGDAIFETGTVEEQVYLYLTSEMGLSSAAAAGVLANIQNESGFDPNIEGDYGTSYGLCQWHAGRWTNLQNFCNANGLDWRTVQGQMEYLNYELGTASYRYIGDYLRSLPNTADGAFNAAYYWCVEFERPADKQNEGVRRGNIAVSTYWPKYQN